MREVKNFQQKETVEILNKCWMTHDGMWFFHCFKEFGIDVTNRLNKSAIKSLAAIEIPRVKKALNLTTAIEDFNQLKAFFKEAGDLMIPDFMNVRFFYPRDNMMAWAFNPHKCFAYAGMKRLSIIDQYECGVLFRIKCWLDELGIPHRFTPAIGKCHMHFKGSCSGEIELFINV